MYFNIKLSKLVLSHFNQIPHPTPQSSSPPSKLLELYIITIFITTQLYLPTFTIQGLSIKASLFLVLTLMTAGAYFILIAKRQAPPISFKNRSSKLVLYTLLLTVCYMLLKLFGTDYTKAVSLEAEVIIVTLLLLYLLVAGNCVIYRYFFLLLLTTAAIAYAGLFYNYVANPAWEGYMEYLLQNTQYITAYLVLMTTVSSLLYCTAKEKTQSLFTFVMSGIGFFLLFITENIIAICIVAVVFLIIPLILTPTAEIIKRNMQLLFLYFFMLSNMSLFSNYLKFVRVELHYNMEMSIYIDLTLSIIAIIFINYWEKIPEDSDKESLLLWNVRKVCSYALQMVGVLTLAIFTAGDKLAQISEKYNMEKVQNFIQKFQQTYNSNNGTLFDILAEFGWIGFIVLILLGIMIIQKVIESYNSEEELSSIVTIISIVFVIQSLFFSQQLVTTPIYFILITLTMNSKQEKRGKI